MDTIYLLLSGLLGFSLFIYYYLTRKFNHWESKGVPYEKPLFLYGNLKSRVHREKSLHEFHRDLYFKFKGSPLLGLFEGSRTCLLVNDPDLIKTILMKDFDYFHDRPFINFKPLSPYSQKMLISLTGNEWKQVRTVLTPAFSSGKLKKMVEIENKCGLQITSYIMDKISENGGSSIDLDMKETLGKFTMDVIASTAFGVELDSNSHPDSEFTKQVAKFSEMNSFVRYLLFFAILFELPEFIIRLIPVSFINIDTLRFLAKVLTDTTHSRKKNGIRRNDFLQLLIDAQSEPLSDEKLNDQETTNEKGPVLSEVVALAQAIIFFIAGYETSGTLLTMFFYEIAKNKQIQEKLRSDVIKKLDEYKGEISYEMINDIPYLDMVLSETLRLYPPVPRLERICVKKYKLGNLDMEPGDRVYIPAYGLHLDPDYYPDPYEFKPERFSPEEKVKRHPCVYLPFGAGPRNCIGLRFALLSIKICIIHLLKEFSVDICDKTPIPFEFNKRSVLLKAKDSVMLSISKLEH